MQNPFQTINKNHNYYIRYFLFLLCAAAVFFIIPKKGRFKFEYEQGKPWAHEDLSAPFTFAVLKNNQDIINQQNEIKESFKPYYSRDVKVENEQKNKL